MRDIILFGFLAAALLTTIRYPFVALMLWAWFTLATPHMAAYVLPHMLPLNLVIAAVTFAVFFFHGEFQRMRFNSTAVWILLFTFWLWISQVFSLKPEWSVVLFDRFLKIMIFIALCTLTATSRLRFHALLWLFILVMGFYGAKGGAYTLVTLGQNTYFGLDYTVLYDNNHMGIAMACTLPLFLYVIRQSSSLLVRLGTWGVFGLTVIGIVGTNSRGAFVSLAVFALFMWWHSKRKIVTAAVVGLAGIIGLQYVPQDWVDRMETIGEAAEDASFRGRLDAWEINYLLAEQNPLTGAGLRVPYLTEVSVTVSDLTPRAAHSIYFEILGGTGFVGLAIFLGMLASAFFNAGAATRKYRGDPEGSWRVQFGRYAQMSIATFAVGAASVSMEMWEGYLLIIALIGALSQINVEATTTKHDFLIQKIRDRTAVDAKKKVKERLPQSSLSTASE